VALVGAAATVPTVKPEPLISLRERLLPLRNPAIGLTIAGLVISGAGGMMVYVYLAPVSRTLAGATPVELALLIAVFGLSGMFGAVLGGAGADRISPPKMIALTFGGTAGGALLLLVLTAFVPIPFVLLAVAIAIYGLFVWSVNPPVQVRLLSVAGDSSAQVLALNVSALYLGFTFAGAIGGLALSLSDVAGLLTASTGLLMLGLVTFAVSFRKEHKHANR
jgi:predicted MFS family arabinose efflux permease